ncbi:unnamed protein product [Cylicocyclus nassatus]|uniref:Metalloendopeptidase n=1 Tax=Cylicocyclus nassatus TaxID=53992 RepID=A0AA36M695_CYLNA|nr:unnamed protein product [Cylicocyclus nassatus]
MSQKAIKMKFAFLVFTTSIMTVMADVVTELWNQYPDSNGNYIVPYQFAGTYSPEERSTILAAMQKIVANTCVQFKERTDEDQYVEITNEESAGCGANVGRVSGKTAVYLESSCMDAKTVMIMLLHALGLSGEHQREDRDDYVKMHFENMIDPKTNAFLAIAESTQKYLSVPYDYLSIMHDAKDAYAKPGTITIETVDPAFEDKIGKQTEPSARDYEKVNLLYQCSKP